MAAQFHFAYPLGYQILGLEEHIAEFAPLNRYKKDFELSSKTEHWRLFGEISDAIQNSGKGLKDIHYTLGNGQQTAFLHQAEITHLQDVSNLINHFYAIGIISGITWLLLLAMAWRFKLAFPPLIKIFLGFISILSLTGMLVILIGAKKVFYWFHTQIFPNNHQWFFYYQDSLMTTLMKAPDIFAFIALVLILLLILCWGLSYWAMTQWLAPISLKSDSKTLEGTTKKKGKSKKKR